MSNKINSIICLILVAALLFGTNGHAKADFTFGTPTNLGPTVNSSAKDGSPSISADGLSLFFTSRRPGSLGRWDLWMTTRPTVSDPWSPPVNLGPSVNSSSVDAEPGISGDGLALFFMSNRTGDYDIWVTTRPSVSEHFGTPVNLGSSVNSSAIEAVPCISADGSTLFFFCVTDLPE